MEFAVDAIAEDYRSSVILMTSCTAFILGAVGNWVVEQALEPNNYLVTFVWVTLVFAVLNCIILFISSIFKYSKLLRKIRFVAVANVASCLFSIGGTLQANIGFLDEMEGCTHPELINELRCETSPHLNTYCGDDITRFCKQFGAGFFLVTLSLIIMAICQPLAVWAARKRLPAVEQYDILEAEWKDMIVAGNSKLTYEDGLDSDFDEYTPLPQ